MSRGGDDVGKMGVRGRVAVRSESDIADLGIHPPIICGYSI